MLSKIKASVFTFLKKHVTKQNIKNHAGPIIIALLTILIPLTIFFCHTQFLEDSKDTLPTDISVSLYDSDGVLIKSEVTQEDIVDAAGLVSLLHSLTSSKVDAQKPAEFNKKQTMSYVISYGEDSTTYKCYFEEDVAQSFFEDQKGGFFSPDSEEYLKFLQSEYSEIIYKESTPPTLLTPLGEEITPSQAEWIYTLNDDTERASRRYETTEEILTYRIEGAINFVFSRTPDVFAVTVKDLSGETVFSGAPEDLVNLNVDENTELLISINSKWEKSDKFSSYGDQHYDFKIICTKPSTFSISATEAFGGQVLFITVNGVYGVDAVYYSTKSGLSYEAKSGNDAHSEALKALYDYTPIFVREGSSAYALLPIPADIPDTVFTFSLSCGISRENITLRLKHSAPTNATAGDALITEAQKAEFSRILFYLRHSKSDILLLNEDFQYPDGYGFTKVQEYNTLINDSFTLLASSYTAGEQSGISVQSANLGIVSEVGYSPLLGNYVIVDHGMGLLSWYCGLSNVGVRENDIVKKGDSIGRAGSSSLLCENGVNIICSVGGILINPESLIKNN